MALGDLSREVLVGEGYPRLALGKENPGTLGLTAWPSAHLKAQAQHKESGGVDTPTFVARNTSYSRPGVCRTIEKVDLKRVTPTQEGSHIHTHILHSEQIWSVGFPYHVCPPGLEQRMICNLIRPRPWGMEPQWQHD